MHIYNLCNCNYMQQDWVYLLYLTTISYYSKIWLEKKKTPGQTTQTEHEHEHRASSTELGLPDHRTGPGVAPSLIMHFSIGAAPALQF